MIWPTSSRVGARIRARGMVARALRSEATRRATSGSRNAYVLPEPVRPRPRTSRPASESGSVAVWIGVGSVMPRSARTRTSSAGTPSAAKPLAEVLAGAAFAGVRAGKSEDTDEVTHVWCVSPRWSRRRRNWRSGASTREGRGPACEQGTRGDPRQDVAGSRYREYGTGPVRRQSAPGGARRTGPGRSATRWSTYPIARGEAPRRDPSCTKSVRRWGSARAGSRQSREGGRGYPGISPTMCRPASWDSPCNCSRGGGSSSAASRDDMKGGMTVEQPVSRAVGSPRHGQRAVREYRLGDDEAAPRRHK